MAPQNIKPAVAIIVVLCQRFNDQIDQAAQFVHEILG